MGVGRPGCWRCDGTGVIPYEKGWRKCYCVTADTRKIQANRRAAEIRTGRKPLTMTDMLRMGGSERRARQDG